MFGEVDVGSHQRGQEAQRGLEEQHGGRRGGQLERRGQGGLRMVSHNNT